MLGTPPSISPDDLYARLGTARAPVLLDVRRNEAFAADDRLIIGAYHAPPDAAERWSRDLPPDRFVVAYCVHGHEVSQGVAKSLGAGGRQAAYLEAGIGGWKEKGLPTRKKVASASDKWVTREHPKIDRIACPWLVSGFIEPRAQFIYVPPNDVLAEAKKTGATPYDIKGVEFGHMGDRCSFDAIVRMYDIHDPALDHLATIVRGADTARPDLTPQCEGLLAISHGLSANCPDDHETLRHGMSIYDALYAWCRMQSHKHN